MRVRGVLEHVGGDCKRVCVVLSGAYCGGGGVFGFVRRDSLASLVAGLTLGSAYWYGSRKIAAGEEKARMMSCCVRQMKRRLKSSQPRLKPGHVRISFQR